MDSNFALGLNLNTDLLPLGMDTTSIFQGINPSLNLSILPSVFDSNPFDMSFLLSMPTCLFDLNPDFGSLTLSNFSNSVSGNDYVNRKISLGKTSPEKAVNRAAGELGQVGGYKYGESGKWCAAFASWAYGGNDAPWGDRHDVVGIKNWAVQNGRYVSGNNTKKLKRGDLVVWRPETSGISHVALVKDVNPDGSFSTIEGNSGNKVKSRNYSSSSNIDGYVSVAA